MKGGNSEVIFWTNPAISQTTREFVSDLPIQFTIVNSWLDLKTVLSRKRKKSTFVFIESAFISESCESLLKAIFSISNTVDVTLINLASPEDRRFKNSMAFKLRYARRVQIWDIEQSGRIVEKLKSISGGNPLESNENIRLTPADEIRRKDESRFEPNRIASSISRELSFISGSIHHDPDSLAESFIQVQQELGSENSDNLTRLSADGQRALQNYISHSRDVATSIDPDNNACAHFGDALWIPNRFTFLLLGERGCGKTTFLSYLFQHYIPKAYPDRDFEYFYIDFLTYDFVTDAQILASKIQQQVYKIKYKGVSQTFGEFASSKNYSPKRLLWNNIPKDLVIDADTREFVASLLTGVEEPELRELLSAISDDENVDTNIDLVNPWKLRNEILNGNDIKATCRIVAHFASKSRIRRESVISEFIVNQALARERCRPYLARAGLDLETLIPSAGQSMIDIAKRFLSFKAEEIDLFFVIDNADRSIAPSVELDIFRTAWDFFPKGTRRHFKMIFAMRTDTFNRHRGPLGRLSDLSLADDVRDYANLYSNTILKSPSFLKVASRRIEQLIGDCKNEKNLKAARFLSSFALGVLRSEEAREIFESLFEGDLRRSLELFEFALGSHHMESTAAYQEAMGRRAGTSHDYVKYHRILSALILGSWDRFRQERNTVFLNVYNANLDPSYPSWQNTLLLPRLLDMISRGGRSGVRICEVYSMLSGAMRYDEEVVKHGLELLKRYRMIEPTQPRAIIIEFDNPDDRTAIRTNDWGTFYSQGFTMTNRFIKGLMFRLEYIQSVYWDTPVPRKFFFKDFDAVMPVERLEEFVDKFYLFIQSEEASEAKNFSSETDQRLRGLDKVSKRISDSCQIQLNNIYRSQK